jgi:hypothetical protein
MSYNQFKSTTVRGEFKNEDWGSVLADAVFDRNVTVGGKLLTAQPLQAGGANYSTGIGTDALFSETGADSRNVAIGYEAMYSTVDGVRNTGIGYKALRNNVSGTRNTSIGNGALIFNTGSYNTGIGFSSGIQVTDGTYNVSIGASASTDGGVSNSTAIGANAFVAHDYSIAVGSGSVSTAAHQIMLGTAAETVACPGNVSVAGTATFTSPPKCAAGPTSSSDLVNRDYLELYFARKSGTNWWEGPNVFQQQSTFNGPIQATALRYAGGCGAYLLSGAQSSHHYPIQFSILDYADFNAKSRTTAITIVVGARDNSTLNLENLDERYAVLPGYRLQVYSAVSYGGSLLLDYTNDWGFVRYVVPVTSNTGRSCRLYYQGSPIN